MRSWRWDLHKKKGGALISDTRELPLSPCVHTKKSVSTQWNGSHLQAKRRGLIMKPTLQALWFWASQPPESWEINFCCLSHPVYDILLWQPKLTNTYYSINCQAYIKCDYSWFASRENNLKSKLASFRVFLFFFLKVFYLFIYLFIYGCVGSSFLCEGFL